ILGAKADRPANGLRALLSSDQPSLARLRRGLAARGIEIKRAIGLFSAETEPGAKADFTAAAEGWLVIAAPGGPMDFELQNTTTPLTLNITRAAPRSSAGFALADPLADPVLALGVQSPPAAAAAVPQAGPVE